jgi:hypothetical protein
VTTLQTVVTTPRLIHMAKSARKRTPSTIVNRTVPRRGTNSELRPREYLTEKEIDRLQEAARKRSRYASPSQPRVALLHTGFDPRSIFVGLSEERPLLECDCR